MKKFVKYSSVNSYETLNSLNDHTENIWFVYHGMGYLSKYFLKYFRHLSPDKNFVVALQAPAKYYLDNSFKNVGASWLTKEDTEVETDNLMSYLDAVYKDVSIPQNVNLFVLGYSQGVSIAARWVARRQIRCQKLILYAGGIPEELTPKDFEYLKGDTEIWMLYGDQDPYLTEKRLIREEEKLRLLFGDKAKKIPFEGGHEFLPDKLDIIAGS